MGLWGADHLGPISTKIGRFKGALNVIILSHFGFNIFRGFRSIGGQNLHLPIDCAGHRYNSSACDSTCSLHLTAVATYVLLSFVIPR